jgi:hypothetical protein
LLPEVVHKAIASQLLRRPLRLLQERSDRAMAQRDVAEDDGEVVATQITQALAG